MEDSITRFSGEYSWLSNFYPVDVILDGRIYPSVEHAYQAAKVHPSQRAPFRSGTAGASKRHGRAVPLPVNWELEKVPIMRSLLAQKFSPDSELACLLIATGGVTLIEGNHWGDTFWGMCNGKGANHLGKLLMEQRTRLQRNLT